MATKQDPRELLVIILEDKDCVTDVLKGLYEAGIPGATMLNSIGGFRAQSWLEDIGLGGVARLFHSEDDQQRMILAVMESELIDGAIAAAELAVGGFGRPHSGLLFTIPVGRTVGLVKRKQPNVQPEPAVSNVDLQVREMPVAKATELLNIEPVTVATNARLSEVTRALLQSPSTHVAAVVSRTNHLLGLVTLRELADHMFFRIIPEIFMSEVYDRDKAEEFGQMSNVRSVGDFMIEPVSIHLDDMVSDAFKLMHSHELSGIPVVDDENHVVGFLSLLELLELVVEEQKPLDE